MKLFLAKFPFARLSTGTKMLLILSAALLPLGIVALITSLDMARAAEAERKTAAQVMTAMYAGRIDSMIEHGLNSTRNIAVGGQPASALCPILGRFSVAGRMVVAVFDSRGRVICQTRGHRVERLAPAAANVQHVWLDAVHKMFRIVAGRSDGSLYVQAELPILALQPAPNEHGLPLVELALRQGSSRVPLIAVPHRSDDRLLQIVLPVADGRLSMIADYRLAPARARTALLVMLPILMWIAAAATGWFVVNRLLLLPLGQLKRSIDAWQATGETFRQPRFNTPSHEIRDLADSFAAASQRILDHERDLEEGLTRQTRLTREVHHRVKNNLQVVSSLINLHARGTEGDAFDAYAAIQRRVDALAVVHRNHYAESEENRGVSIRSLAGELATSLRASAPSAASGMPIALNMIDVSVTQDVAVPVAFLITEVVELLMLTSAQGSILISLKRGDQPQRARLRIESVGRIEPLDPEDPRFSRFDRVVTGIARQFRAPLSRDLQQVQFEVDIVILG